MIQNYFFYGFILFIICSLIRCTDATSALEGVDHSSVLWKGKWKSAEYLFVFGSVAVRLPKIIEMNKEIYAPIAISFSPMNVYRPGRTYVAQYKGKLKNNLPRLTNNLPTGASHSHQTSHLGLTFVDGKDDIAEAFYIQFNGDMNEATGYWRSVDGDFGKFTLEKSDPI